MSATTTADDAFEAQNDAVGQGVLVRDKMDNDYASRTGQYQVPVQKDEKPVKDPIDPATADSDETLGTIVSFRHLLSLSCAF